MVGNEKLLAMLEGCKLDDLKRALLENIRDEAQKKAGTKASDTAIIKRVTKCYSGYAVRFDKAHKFERNEKEYYGFTEDHYILASGSAFGYEEAEAHERIGMEKLFLADYMYDTEIEIDLAEVKAFAKYIKSIKRKDLPYCLEMNGKYIGFNPAILADVCDFTDSTKLYIQRIDSNCLKTPAFVKSADEERMAIILPVNITDGQKSMEIMQKYRNNEL